MKEQMPNKQEKVIHGKRHYLDFTLSVRSRVLGRVTFPQLLNALSAYYGTRSFVTLITFDEEYT
jgi:hypothetical protein